MSVMPRASQSDSSDYFEDDDSQFLEALANAVLPGDVPLDAKDEQPKSQQSQISTTSEELKPPSPAQPSLKRRYSAFRYSDEDEPAQSLPAHIPSEGDSDDDIYGAAHFGDFGEYMRRKRAKLQIQNASIAQTDEGIKSQIFKGISIYINGWTRPSVQELRHLIVQHGGIFQAYLDKKALVTHIITCSLTPAKIREFKHMKVVRPEWIVESIEKGLLLPWRNYMYIHEERIETTQGAKGNQTSLLDQQSRTSGSSSTSSYPIITSAPPRATSTSKPTESKPAAASFLKSSKPLPAPDPLYTTDPGNNADAARVPGYAAHGSNPNAKRVMANPEWRKAHTSVASDFIDGYYKNSRLHHLSTWKSELKNLVQEAQERAESGPFSGHVGKITSEAETGAAVSTSASVGVSMRGAELVKKSPTSKWKGKGKAVDDEERVIMHCDFDCFFVSAGLVSRPELKGKPVVVCHSQGAQGGMSSTSEIASSSYEARKFGIKNGMSLQQARQLCTEVVTIPYEFERYKQFSLLFYTVLMSHADDLQAVSVDEALIDVTSTIKQLRTQSGVDGSLHDYAIDFAETIRAQVRKATSCEVSIGISHNILLARLATRRAKPAGSYHLLPAEVPEFLEPLTISDLHGFGWSTKQKAQEKLGVVTLGDLAKKSKGVLMEALGKTTGETLYNDIRGIDDKKLESDKPRKSVSCEINYGIRFENNEQAEAFIYQMAAEVKKRLDAIDMVGRSITLKVMKRDPTAPVEPPKFLGHGACDLFNKQIPLIGPGGKATSDDQVIGSHAWRLLKSFNFDPKELRGIGIQVQKLESASATSRAPPGQKVLAFGAKPINSSTSAGAGTSKIGVAAPQPLVQTLSRDKDEDVTMGDPVKPSTVQFDLPSLSQVDRNVLDALPRDIREELENEYKRRSEASSTSGAGAAGAVQSKHVTFASPGKQFNRRSATPSIFPQKPFNKGGNMKRITQQLAPHSRAGLSPQKSALHMWALKLRKKYEKKKEGVRITDAALRDLKLDPEVFRALPVRIQREQLVMARIIKDKGSLPEPPSQRKVLKPRKHDLPPGFVVYRAPKPKARHIPPPFLRQQGKKKGEKLYFTEADDIQRVVETWVMTYQHWAPKDKDVEFLSKYLVQSVDRAKATDVGVERAVAVMKWWLVLLRRLFGAWENMDEDDLASSQRNHVGEAWWDACHRVQEQMDEVTRKRFGGRLSYR
ncbi:hypothetical protein CPB84DRAFT_1962837 [Gymnopilus junonius]|uniref:DNA repair protein REV1 n=1 Tax=Gymnopilus junonius TaxID=109634 RepID=A0A9P5TN70_GYMJU|nr:hypothetical protein CPB84DRAFT_1962837 [Gymnopilus junonius]